MSVFDDQRGFMEACGQSTGVYNERQVFLYANLLLEETEETRSAAIRLPLRGRVPSPQQLAAVADGALDVIVVAVGVLHSLGVDPQELWDEVVRSNLAKIDPATGRVRKREDGKVLKPEGWKPPRLAELIEEQRTKGSMSERLTHK